MNLQLAQSQCLYSALLCNISYLASRTITADEHISALGILALPRISAHLARSISDDLRQHRIGHDLRDDRERLYLVASSGVLVYRQTLRLSIDADIHLWALTHCLYIKCKVPRTDQYS